MYIYLGLHSHNIGKAQIEYSNKQQVLVAAPAWSQLRQVENIEGKSE